MSTEAARAWSFTTPPFPSTLKLESFPVPASPQPNELFVKVQAAALNPVDVQLANAPIFRLGNLAYPKGIGCDFSGIVTAVGDKVTNFNSGDHVCGLALQPLGKPLARALGQVLVIDPSTAPIIKKPSQLSWEQAASVPLVGLTAMTCLQPPYCVVPPKSTDKPSPPTVVVLGGSSGVGVYCVQLAVKTLNANVIATCSQRNVDFVKGLGATTVIDYTQENVVERLKDMRPSEGYLTIIDCVGGTDLLPHNQSLLMPRSTEFPQGGSFTTIVGDKVSRASLGGSTIYWWNPRMVLRNFLGYWAKIKYRYACIMLRPESALLQQVFDELEQGGKIVIDSEYKFEEVDKAYERLNTARARGKVVVHVAS